MFGRVTIFLNRCELYRPLQHIIDQQQDKADIAAMSILPILSDDMHRVPF